MSKLRLPEETNYISCFLTWRCPMGCSYCLNKTSGFKGCEAELTGKEWVKIINRIPHDDNLPITLGGGEPTQHKDFYDIIKNANGPFDLLSNGQFDVNTFIENVPVDKFRRWPGKDTGVWFNSIRISYHAREWDEDNRNAYENRILLAVEKLRNAGFLAGFTCPDHPRFQAQIGAFETRAKNNGIPFQRKTMLGEIDGKLYGTFKWPVGVCGLMQSCRCMNNEVLIAPDGFVYRCHSDLYNHECAIGHALMQNYAPVFKYRPCDKLGACSPCDCKSKTNRYGEPDSCAIKITAFDSQITVGGTGAVSNCDWSCGR